jgi:hypothetical protein
MVFQPRHVDERIAAQSSWFTVHPEVNNEDGFVNLKEGATCNNAKISEMVIAAEMFGHLRDALQDLAIHNALLFPGLDGTCRMLQERLIPWNAPRPAFDSSQ